MYVEFRIDPLKQKEPNAQALGNHIVALIKMEEEEEEVVMVLVVVENERCVVLKRNKEAESNPSCAVLHP